MRELNSLMSKVLFDILCTIIPKVLISLKKYSCYAAFFSVENEKILKGSYVLKNRLIFPKSKPNIYLYIV